MLAFVLGTIIGSVMGLTGSGGALVSIPLFMHFLGMNLKDASVYSLSALIFASVINFLMQKKDAHIKESLIIVVLSAIGSYVSTPWKLQIPDSIITILLISISAFALINVWASKQVHNRHLPKKSLSYYFILIFSGFILGVLTTLTGLGGGVLLIPVMLRYLHLNHREAIASSLLAIALSSLFSLLIQIHHGVNFIVDFNTIILFAGMTCSALILKLSFKHVSSHTLLLFQRVVFSAVVIMAWLKLLL